MLPTCIPWFKASDVGITVTAGDGFILTTAEGNFDSCEGCGNCCNFSDVVVDKLTVTDDNELEFTDDNEVGLTDTAGCVGITIAVAKVEGVIVLLVDADDRVGKVVGVTVTPERLTGLFIARVEKTFSIQSKLNQFLGIRL